MNVNKEGFSVGRFFREMFIQIWTARWLLIIYSALILLILAGIWFVASRYGIDAGKFTMDPSTLGGGFHPLFGFVSTIGLFLWTASAAVCLFVFIACRVQLEREIRRFLFWSALLTLYLLMDDAFLIHEFIVPYHFHVDQKYAIFMNILFSLTYLVAFYKTILKTEYVLLILSFFYVALSITFDYIDDYYHLELDILIEDGFKFFGIVTWFLYFFRTNLSLVRKSLHGMSPGKPLQ